MAAPPAKVTRRPCRIFVSGRRSSLSSVCRLSDAPPFPVSQLSHPPSIGYPLLGSRVPIPDVRDVIDVTQTSSIVFFEGPDAKNPRKRSVSFPVIEDLNRSIPRIMLDSRRDKNVLLLSGFYIVQKAIRFRADSVSNICTIFHVVKFSFISRLLSEVDIMENRSGFRF